MNRKLLSLGFVFSALVILAVSCNGKSEPGSASAASPTSATVAATSDRTNQVGEPADSLLPGPDSAARTVYRDTAGRVINLVGQTAQILSSVGLSLVFVEGDRSETKGIAEAAIGSFDLARVSLEADAVPDDMAEFHTAMLEAIGLYSTAAHVLIDLPDTTEYDVFEFQGPFHEGGAKFHEAGSLFSPTRE